MDRRGLLVDGHVVATVEVADSWRTRGRGLLGRDGLDGALWLRPCRHVHTMRMKFAIDVAHVAADGTVLDVQTLVPQRFARWHPRTRSIVEAEAGQFAAWGVTPGVVLDAGEVIAPA